MIDCVSEKPAEDAATLLHRFGSLRRVLAARSSSIAVSSGERVAQLIASVRETITAQALSTVDGRPLKSCDRSLHRFLITKLSKRTTEALLALFLDAGNRLIRAEVLAEGTPAHVAITPRAVLSRALELEATALLLAHNHPGGQRMPSAVDVEFTARINTAGSELGVCLHDHFIVVDNECLSMSKMGLLR